MTYRTCVGCIQQGQPCETRDKLRDKLKGLGVTSIKWKCSARVARLKRGDAVWAYTIDGSNEYADNGSPFYDYFPAVVIKQTGSKMLVYIKPGVAGRDLDNTTFKTDKNGFCKTPLSRLTQRDGDAEEVCRFCDLPASLGHQYGYICNPADAPELVA